MLKEAGITPLREVAEVTGFPEMLDGRVKTIHPRVAGGVLASRSKPDHMSALAAHDIPPIDLVAVNLYPFEKIAAQPGATLEDLIENIDIGGPTMIRAGAKNWQDVAVVTSPTDYPALVEELRTNQGDLSRDTHWSLAKKAFSTTAAYDHAISARLAQIPPDGLELPAILDVRASRRFALRYGENPHQQAALYSTGTTGIAGAEQLQGKELSYNNLVDLDAAWQLILEFLEPAAAIIKHTNPCGCAESATLAESYRQAFEADPASVRRHPGLQPTGRLEHGGGSFEDQNNGGGHRRAGLLAGSLTGFRGAEESSLAPRAEHRARLGDQVHHRRLSCADGGYRSLDAVRLARDDADRSHGRTMERA